MITLIMVALMMMIMMPTPNCQPSRVSLCYLLQGDDEDHDENVMEMMIVMIVYLDILTVISELFILTSTIQRKYCLAKIIVTHSFPFFK